MRHALALLAVTGPMLCNVAFAAPAGPDERVAGFVVRIVAALADKRFDNADEMTRSSLRYARLTLGPQSLEVANLDRLLGETLFERDRFADALPLYRDAYATREKLLGVSKDTAVSASDLGFVLKNLRRFEEAEAYFRKAFELRQMVLVPDDPQTAKSAFWLARMIDSNGRTAEAAEMMGQAVDRASVSFGPNDPFTVQCIGERAAMLHNSNDLAGAEPLYRMAIRLGAKAFDADDWRLAADRHGLANLLVSTGRSTEAVPLYRQALAARQASFGSSDPETISSAYRLARVLLDTDETKEAEALFRRVLTAREASDGPNSVAVADVLRWLGRTVDRQSHLAEAEIIYKRVLAISESRLGPRDVLTAFDLIALGELYSGQQRFAESRPLLEAGIGILDDSPDYREAASSARMALSFLELAAGDRSEALALAEQSLAQIEATKGAQSLEAASAMAIVGGFRQQAGDLVGAEDLVAKALVTTARLSPHSRDHIRTISLLASIKQGRGQLDEALALDREAEAALSERYGLDNAELQTVFADIGEVLYRQDDYAGAAQNFARSAAMIEGLAAIDSTTSFQERTGKIEDPAIARAAVFDKLVKADFQIGPQHAEDAFIAAQRVIESEAANALQQMAMRQAAGEDGLGHLIRERQDLVGAWRQDDAGLSKALGTGGADVSALRESLAATDARIVAIDGTLAARYPEFAHLQRPAPLDLLTVRGRLAEAEVLLFFADTGRIGDEATETYLWAVPKSGAVRWVKLPRPTTDLVEILREMRGSLGVGAQVRGPTPIATSAGQDRIARMIGAASELYAALLGQVGDLIEGKALVIVPSRSLAPLPFQALVAAPPPAASTDRYRDAHWLALDHAVTILPSVASLRPTPVAEGSAGTDPYVAFANPLLTGHGGTDLRALGRTGCAAAPHVQTAQLDPLPATEMLFRGASADVAMVRSLPPLPETTDEVCAIAAILGAGPGALHLGADATESTLRALSADGKLARARIVHFATHGLVSGDLKGLAEPAIVLTPPAHASAADDGLLTASEVTELKLDADWVILSACNTASSDGGGEALSGLARAFFYAGARALLVSHWPVNSEATVRLVSNTIAALEADPSIGRAEALRRAMVAEIARGGAAADPASWAPFILVGS